MDTRIFGVQVVLFFQGHERNQLRVAQNNNGLPNSRELAESRLDLVRLHPKPPDLDLVVPPPKILEIAVRQVTGQVTRSIEPFALVTWERVGTKLFGGHLRLTPVANRQVRAADIEFASYADRAWLHRFVQHIDACSGQRFSNS